MFMMNFNAGSKHFLFWASRPGVEGLLSVTQCCVWLGSLKGHLMFSHTLCFSFTIFAWSYLSLQQEKVLPAVKLLNWYRLHFSVESFFLLGHVKRKRGGGRGKGDEVWSLCSHRFSSFSNMKNYYSLARCLEEWVWTNFKHTGMTCSKQLISVCNPVTFGIFLSITHSREQSTNFKYFSFTKQNL